MHLRLKLRKMWAISPYRYGTTERYLYGNMNLLFELLPYQNKKNAELSHSVLFGETYVLVIHGERSDCEFEDLDLEYLTVERGNFKGIEKLNSKCIFELAGVKEVFLPSGINTVSGDAFSPKFAASIPSLVGIHILDAAKINRTSFHPMACSFTGMVCAMFLLNFPLERGNLPI